MIPWDGAGKDGLVGVFGGGTGLGGYLRIAMTGVEYTIYELICALCTLSPGT